MAKKTNRQDQGRKAGRPATLTMPEPIPDTLENVAKAVLTTPPRKRNEWKFIQEHDELTQTTEQAAKES